MSKAEILAGLSGLQPCELAEVQAKLDELIGDAWLAESDLSDVEKSALNSALADYQKNPDEGSSWEQVRVRIQGRLSP